jgi:ribosome-binding ATPase YchF (GTP1/OBG family)
MLAIVLKDAEEMFFVVVDVGEDDDKHYVIQEEEEEVTIPEEEVTIAEEEVTIADEKSLKRKQKKLVEEEETKKKETKRAKSDDAEVIYVAVSDDVDCAPLLFHSMQSTWEELKPQVANYHVLVQEAKAQVKVKAVEVRTY